MKLTGLQIANFKGFGDLQEISIRPITLIYGANSSGKSSILHALALAHEAIGTKNLDVYKTGVGGESIDLGGFRQYIHRRDTNQSVSFGFKLEDRSRRTERKIVIESEIELIETEPSLTKFSLSIDNDKILTMSRESQDSPLKIDDLKYEHEFIHTRTGGLGYTVNQEIKEALISRKKSNLLDGYFKDLSSKLSINSLGIFPSINKPKAKRATLGDVTDLNAHYRLLDEALNYIAGKVAERFDKFQYLGPLRSYPPRHLISTKYDDANWRAGGGYAWDVISRNESDALRKKVNEWLGSERLKVRYELIPREFVALNEAKKPVDSFNVPILLDRRTETEVSHRDVGIGISQVLPVLVYAYASRGELLAIEQPEIHLHPALQAELGDVFIESALGKHTGNTLLLETHSEHLLLRIMRRMRETCEGELQEGSLPVHPEDVMVLFVEPHGSSSLIREMPLNERGNLEEEWPDGFFEEDLKEIF